MMKVIVSRNIVLYLALGLIMSKSVDWGKCFNQRGRYLLGIYYNGYFQNNRDGIVYKDYLRRQGTTHESFVQNIF